MVCDKIDLYEYFGVSRANATGGYLKICAPDLMSEVPNATRPAMLVMPGGGYAFLSEREAEPVALAFAAKGYAAFILYYTLNTAFPVPLIEACMAIAYIRKNAKTYAVDAEHVGAIGFSAGGNLAAMLATMYGDKAVKDVLGNADCRADAVILSYAVATTGERTSHGGTSAIISGGDCELRKRVSPDLNVTEDSSPAFIWHTMEDDCVPVEGVMLYAEACKAHGVPFAMHIFEHGGHGMGLCDDVVNTRLPETVTAERVDRWFALAIDWLSSRGFKVTHKK